MKKKTKQVLSILKPKCKALGFNLEELEGIAADIADNLELDEEASEEEINEKISSEVEAVIPYLKIAQKASNRVIQNSKNNKNPESDDNDTNAGQDGVDQEKEEEKVPVWAQAIITQQKAIQTELTGLKSERETDGRRSKLKALLKDTGTFGKSTLKNFDKIKFENEADFEEFYDGVVEDLATLNQERANAGLAKLGATAATSGNKKEKEGDKPEVISEKEIEELAGTM
ncbi:hypothetical protein [Leyella stercorea]|jgi:hypothetical protein|uniref:hypothetical protein n=1 Tax=Leyella stercorea TaxID=363265 RepID=UPI002058799D|nr:hypothetical protein [Leyella stercorea]DAQ20132.1 MAG TPA: hypothetical protein [Caudoviricetes sp.]